MKTVPVHKAVEFPVVTAVPEGNPSILGSCEGISDHGVAKLEDFLCKINTHPLAYPHFRKNTLPSIAGVEHDGYGTTPGIMQEGFGAAFSAMKCPRVAPYAVMNPNHVAVGKSLGYGVRHHRNRRGC